MVSDKLEYNKVSLVNILPGQEGQRIDNFLLSRLKGVPKSRIYRLIRKGEVRVNKKRIKAEYKLKVEDQVRIPPVRVADRNAPPAVSDSLRACLEAALLYEDEQVLVFNKPAGLAVHAGTGVSLGMIEALRQLYDDKQLELVHRLDKGTSGCLLVARSLASLNTLSAAFKARKVKKTYHALVAGHWPSNLQRVDAPLQRLTPRNGERRVEVDSDGKQAVTEFHVLQTLPGHTLLEARPLTGRTHQIRVHTRLSGHAICGDEKYRADAELKRDREQGIRRLCLHARGLELQLPNGQPLSVSAPYDAGFSNILRALDSGDQSPVRASSRTER